MSSVCYGGGGGGGGGGGWDGRWGEGGNGGKRWRVGGGGGVGGGGAVKALFATVHRGPQCKANTNVASVGFPARDGAAVKRSISLCIVIHFSIIGGSCHKYHLTRQNTSFVATNIFLSQHNFCRDKYLSWQTILSRQMFCCDKLTFVATNTYACHDKTFVATNTSFVATKLCLSQQKFCRGKHTFVATKDVVCRDKNYTCGISSQ